MNEFAPVDVAFAVGIFAVGLLLWLLLVPRNARGSGTAADNPATTFKQDLERLADETSALAERAALLPGADGNRNNPTRPENNDTQPRDKR